MPRLRKLGRVGLTLLLLNEIRGALVVATLLANGAHAMPTRPAGLERLSARLVCAIKGAPCPGAIQTRDPL
jgi:hypothetical protein